MKYNEPDRFERMKRSYQTFAKIDRRGWPEPFMQRVKQTYWLFLSEGIELSDHGAERFLNRKDANGEHYKFAEICEIMRMQVNYLQEGMRNVRYYNGIAIVTNSQTGEIVSIITRNKPKADWRKLE